MQLLTAIAERLGQRFRRAEARREELPLRFSHQESVPFEGCDRLRWPGLQRVVRDFQRGPSEQAPAKRHSALGRLTALTCRDASLARPWTANPGEKTSLDAEAQEIEPL